MAAEIEDVPEGSSVDDVGLIAKYYVSKIKSRDSGGEIAEVEPVEGMVFVLKPDSDPLARAALRTYAAEAGAAGKFKLRSDIHNWLDSLEAREAMEKAQQRMDETLANLQAAEAKRQRGVEERRRQMP